MKTLIGIEKYIVVSVAGLTARIPNANCFWCGNQDYICGVCHNRANRALASLQRTADRRSAHAKGESHAE